MASFCNMRKDTVSLWGFSYRLLHTDISDSTNSHPVCGRVVLHGLFRDQRRDAGHDGWLGLGVFAARIFESVPLPVALSRFALLTAVAMPASMIVQFSLVASFHPSLITAVAWSLLMAAMATPYVFSGVVVSLALTRSPFPVGQVYGVDLLGAALGCASVIGLLNLLDGPTAVIVAGAIAAVSALAFSSSDQDRKLWKLKPWWQRPGPVAIVLLGFAAFNAISPMNSRPILVKENFESSFQHIYEKWNSYSRVRAYPLATGSPVPVLWGASNRDSLRFEGPVHRNGHRWRRRHHHVPLRRNPRLHQLSPL